MTIDELIKYGENLLKRMSIGSFNEHDDNVNNYDEWKRLALMFIQQHYPNHPQTATFHEYVGRRYHTENCRCLLSILKAFKEIEPKSNIDHNTILDNIFNHFHVFSRQLKRRYDNRPPFEIKDEYDVQDLLHAIFKLHFEDVRPEEWTPSYAGSCKKMDFLLKDFGIAVEIKMTRQSLRDKDIGDQLIIDIAHYKEHPNCNMLFCFVYDPEGLIRNPRGLEKDLEGLSNDLPVKMYIRPME